VANVVANTTEVKADADTELAEIRASVRSLCERFPDEYWRNLDRNRAYAEEFVAAVTKAGWLSILIPEEYGGGGGTFFQASAVLEELSRAGCSARDCHAQMYTMGAVLRHGSEEQKRRYLPGIAAGELRLQSFAITEPNAGSDTTRISTFARREGGSYFVSGQKIFTSRVQHSDLLMLLARTTPLRDCTKKTDGMSLFLLDLREARDTLTVRPIETMVNHETNELFFDDVEIPVENRIGEEGKGFRYILSGMNSERILIASECIGDGLWLIDKACKYARERIVFGRPIGANQGVQFPIAKAYANLEAAALMRNDAARRFDAGEEPGAQANMAKYLASEAAWEAANAAMTTFGGYGYVREFDVERKFREARLPLVAPVANNLVLSYVGQHVLKLPRSY